MTEVASESSDGGSAKVWMPCRASDQQIRDIHDFLKDHCGEPVVLVASRNWPTPEQTTVDDVLTKTRWGRIKSLIFVTPTVRIVLADLPGTTVRVSWTAEKEDVGRRLLAMAKDCRKWWLLGGYPETVLLVFVLLMASFWYAGTREAIREAEVAQRAAEEHNAKIRREVGEERFRALLEEARKRSEADARAVEHRTSGGLPWWANILALGGMFALVAWISPAALRILWLPALPFILLQRFLGKIFPAFWFDTASTPNAYWGGKLARVVGALIPVGSLALAVYKTVVAP